MKTQKNLLRELDVDERESWVLILDCGRPDYFQDFYTEYIDGEYQTVYNGGNFWTMPWFNEMFSYLVDGHLFHGGQPIRKIRNSVDYDERDYFNHVPSATTYPIVEEQDKWATSDPAGVNEVVRQHLPEDSMVNDRLYHLGYTMSESDDAPEMNMNVVRYLQPHTPYKAITSFGDHRNGVRKRIRDQDHSFSKQDWFDAYEANYRWGLEQAAELAEELARRDANVVITADHGECLGECGQWFHGPKLDSEHEHICGVPWLEVA
jgi:(2Fe-2S) ferredoxin